MKNLKIGEKLTRVPLIQGGMGVGSYPLHRSAIASRILTGIRKKPICAPLRVR